MKYLTKRNTADIYPLSPMQQGMLFHSLFEKDSSAYFDQFGCYIDGKLNIKYIEEAWNHLINKNPIFRTVFNWEVADEPLQIVLKEMPIRLIINTTCYGVVIIFY